ncbi:MAG: isochorismatase family protein [Planctomycetales bacterium]|nr:isochorismatase family protein [Planctomycetales bacterium]
MIRPIIKLRKKRILIDVDTQRDLFLADGKACVRNHRRVLANIRRVMAWTRKEQIRTISTALIHSSGGNGNGFCLVGTEGICKIPYTLRNRRILFDSSDSTDLPRELLRASDQVILCKRTEDPFDEPRAERVLTEARAAEFIVIGGPIETSVLYTVLGLLIRNKPVTVIVDAVGSREKTAADVAMRKMQAKGAKLVDSKSLLGATHLRLVNACRCDRCRGRIHSGAF